MYVETGVDFIPRGQFNVWGNVMYIRVRKNHGKRSFPYTYLHTCTYIGKDLETSESKKVQR
jgi:hypothetical protein